MSSIYKMIKVYTDYIDKNEGTDVEFPGFKFGKHAKKSKFNNKKERS